jgi:cytochrome c nitrite reductase small subunit
MKTMPTAQTPRRFFAPGRRSVAAVAVAMGLATGLAAGLGVYTFVYARGLSYLTDDPRACANCHIMDDYYAAWTHGSHHAVAVCNDCHTPPGFVPKYFTKSLNGYNHSLAFTTGRFHEPIQVTPRNHRITEGACRKCHREIVQAIDMPHAGAEPLSCVRCHDSVGHMH